MQKVERKVEQKVEQKKSKDKVKTEEIPIWYEKTKSSLILKSGILAEYLAENMDFIFTRGNFYQYRDGVYKMLQEEEQAVILGKSDKEIVRELVFSGYFRFNRVKDTEIIDTGCYIAGEGKEIVKDNLTYGKIDLEETLKELSIEMADKGEKIEGTDEEVIEKIKNNVKGGKK